MPLENTAKHFTNWAKNAKRELYGKPSQGSVEKSKRRHNSKLKALSKYK